MKKRSFDIPKNGPNNAALGAALGGLYGLGTEALSYDERKHYLKRMILNSLFGGALGLAASKAGAPDMWKKLKPVFEDAGDKVVKSVNGLKKKGSVEKDPRFKALKVLHPGLRSRDVEFDGPFLNVKGVNGDAEKYKKRRARLKMLILAAAGGMYGARLGAGKSKNKAAGGLAGGILGMGTGLGIGALSNAARDYAGMDPLLPTTALART